MPRRPVPLIALLAGLLSIGAIGCGSSNTGSSAKSSKDTFCALLLAFRTSNDALSADVSSGDPAKTQSAVTRLVGQAQTLKDRAPAGIATDVANTVSFLAQFQALLSRYSYDLDKLQADPAGVEQFTALNTEDVQASLEQLRSYGDAECAATAASTTGSATPAATNP